MVTETLRMEGGGEAVACEEGGHQGAWEGRIDSSWQGGAKCVGVGRKQQQSHTKSEERSPLKYRMLVASLAQMCWINI